MRPNDHLDGQGCRKCSDKKTSTRLRSNQSEFIINARSVHNNKYDYSLVNYRGTYDKVIIICKIHGKFLQTPNSHLNGQGCRKCYNQSKQLSTSDFVEQSSQIHNNIYSYVKTIYCSSKNKVIIKCKIHGEFLQRPNDHLSGRGCPKCNASKGEECIKKELEIRKLKYYFQKSFNNCRNPKTGNKLKFDFYIPSKNLLIEYDGKQHFECGIFMGKHKTTKLDLIDTQRRDAIKNNYCIDNNISLLRIKYSDKKHIPTIISLI
jgi:hypothetical protein